MAGPRHLCVIILVHLTIIFFQGTDSKGFIDVKLLSYDHDCTEDFGISDCDPMFRFCLSRPSSKVSFSKSFCKYSYKKSDHFQDDDFINFQTIGNKRGVPVPWKIEFEDLYDSQIMLSIQVYDHDSGFLFSDHDHMVTFYKTMSYTIHPSESEADYDSYRLSKSGDVFKFQIRLFCEDNYYGSDCKTYCLAQNSDTGHYLCEKGTGKKLCLKGWTGSNCEIDIDECSLGYCQRGDCENTPGDYNCICPLLYSGKNCTINNNPCQTANCKNGGTCLLNPSDLTFTCLCTDGWAGRLCDLRINPCESGPCQNGGSCTASSNNEDFSCYCPSSHTGKKCHVPTTTTKLTTTSTHSTTTTTPETTTTPTTTTPSTTSTTTTPSTTSTTYATSSTSTTRPTSTTPISVVGQGEKVTQSKIDQPLFALFSIIPIIAIILIACFVVLRRRKDRKLLFTTEGLPPPSAAVIVYDQHEGHLSFENVMYTETNRTNMQVERSQQGIPPVPVCPPDELFYPTKPPKNTEYEEPVMGAEGGTYDNRFVKEKELDKDSTGTKAAEATRLDQAPNERAENNPYQDFRSLTQKKSKAKDEEEKIEMSRDEDDLCMDEEDLYQELDEMAMRADRTPTVSFDSFRDSVPPPFVPPPRIQSLAPQELPPALPHRGPGTKESHTATQGPSSEYADIREENDGDYDLTDPPYTTVDKSRHSTGTLPLRSTFKNSDYETHVDSQDSGYDIPSGIGPRAVTENQDPAIYDSPRNSSVSHEASASSEYNVPRPSPKSGPTKTPVGLVVTNNPWTPDPFQSGEVNENNNNGEGNPQVTEMSYDESSSSDDDEPEVIKHLKNEVKNDLDFVLLKTNPTDSKI